MFEDIERLMIIVDEAKKTLETLESNEIVIEYNNAKSNLTEWEGVLKNSMDGTDFSKVEKWIPGRKEGTETIREGRVEIQRKKTSRRKIVSELFIKHFPFLAQKLAHYTLKDVEPELSKEDFEKITLKEESYGYKAILKASTPPPTDTKQSTKKKQRKVKETIKA
jgi:hypothetical protein